jgi:hypothetical protein
LRAQVSSLQGEVEGKQAQIAHLEGEVKQLEARPPVAAAGAGESVVCFGILLCSFASAGLVGAGASVAVAAAVSSGGGGGGGGAEVQRLQVRSTFSLFPDVCLTDVLG